MTPSLGELKRQAQKLEATIKLGKEGVTPQFLAALDQALAHRELVKVRFEFFKEQKKQLAPELAQKTNSRLVMRVGHVAVFYRERPKPPE